MDYSDITTQVCDLHEQHLKELMILHDSTLKQGEEGVLLCLRRHNNCLAGDLGEALGLTTGRVALLTY